MNQVPIGVQAHAGFEISQSREHVRREAVVAQIECDVSTPGAIAAHSGAAHLGVAIPQDNAGPRQPLAREGLVGAANGAREGGDGDGCVGACHGLGRLWVN